MKRLMDHVEYCAQVKTSGDGPAFELTNVSQPRTLARVCTRNGPLALSFRLILIIIASQVGSLNSVAQHTYTSPIDITGLKVQLHAVAPDRNSGNPTDVALPVGFLGPQMNQLFATPLSAQFDQYWSSTRDLKTGLTQREQICNKIKDEVNTRAGGLGKGISPYDFVCELAPTGKLLAHQVGSTMDIGYLLTNNKVSIALTTPATCHAGHGTPLCPNDPRLIITFAAEITTVIRTPDLCRLSTEPVTALLQAVHVDTGGVANVAKLGDELIFGDKHFAALEQAIQSWEQQKPSPLAGAFNEMRNSDACTGRNPALRIALGAFRTFETLIQPPQGIILRTTHVGIPAPQVDAPNPGASATASQPTFTHPMISTSRPSVAAGTAVQISGQYFPLNPSLTNAVPITLLHTGYGGNSVVLGGGSCIGGATELQWGPANGPMRVERMPGGALGACAAGYNVTGLTPATAYQFRARDCDAITCSLWSAPLRMTTDPANSDRGNVLLTIDGSPVVENGPVHRPAGSAAAVRGPQIGSTTTAEQRPLATSAAVRGPQSSSTTMLSQRAVVTAAVGRGTQIGSGTITPQGTFQTTATIPAGVAPGQHTIRAVNGNATAEVTVMVTAPNSGGQASLMMVGLLSGETGCPNHSISSIQTDTNLTLFGAGFSAGPITIHLDAPTAPALGTAMAGTDGAFCQKIPGPHANQAGAHRLIAVQSGTVRAQTQVIFVLPSIVR